MLTLTEVVELTKIQLGQVLIPISAFGYTYERLERIFVESIKFFEKFYPLEKMIETSISGDGIKIDDAIQVQYLRYVFGKFENTIPKVEKNLYTFNNATRILKSEIMFTAKVFYHAHYPVGYFKIESADIGTLYKEEDKVESLFFKGHFKRGTLKIELDEGIVPESSAIIDSITDIITIQGFTGSLLYTGTIINFRNDALGTLPNPVLLNTDYWVIKISNTQIKIASTEANALANIPIDLTTNGTPKIFINKVNFSLKEDLNSYKTFSSAFTVNTTTNVITLNDSMFNNRIEDGDEITVSSTLTLPNPLLLNTKYFIIVLSENTCKLADSRTNALLGIPIVLTTTGVGVLTANTSNDTLEYIHAYGNLGRAEIKLADVTGNFYNDFGRQGTLKITFASKYKCAEFLDIDSDYSDFLMAVFKQKFAEGLGRQKMTVKLEGLPTDITMDNLVQAQADLKAEVTEFTHSRGKWWLSS